MLGLVLEGGAMRGLFTAGVLDVMMENGIAVDGIMGVSAGAAFGCNYKSNQKGRALRYNKRFCKEWRYASFRSWLLTGDLYGEDFCYRRVPLELDVFDSKAFAASPCAYYAVCTDVETGLPVYAKCDKGDERDLRWIQASASMPLASRMVMIDGRPMLDGGISDSIPLKKMQQLGYERNIVILTQPEGYRKQPNKLVPLMRLFYRRYPALPETLARRHDAYNAQLDYVSACEEQGNTLVIRPEMKLAVSSP